MDTFKNILGFGAAPAAMMGPDKSTLLAQQQQDQKLQQDAARTARETQARQAIINATQGRGGPVTLFRRTGPARPSALGASAAG